MTPRLTCPHARYISEMRIFCDAANDLCGNVYFKTCKGWWVLSENAARCPLRRKENTDGHCICKSEYSRTK